MKEIKAILELDGPTLSLGSYQSGSELRDDSFISSILDKVDYTFSNTEELEKMRKILFGTN